MKRKAIPSMLHNFGHSFISSMNYVDDVYIRDLLPSLARAAPGGRLLIHFPSGRIEPTSDEPQALIKSIAYWSDWLPRHMENHGIRSTAIVDVVLVVAVTSEGISCEVRASDDLGTEYVAPVKFAT